MFRMKIKCYPCDENSQNFVYSLNLSWTSAELGDFNSVEHTEGYLNDLQLLVDQNDETERQISELHKLHRGQMPGMTVIGLSLFLILNFLTF